MSRHFISSFLLLNQHLQQFECMVPIILEKARDTQEHAQRLNGPCRFRLSHIGCFPTNLTLPAAFSSLHFTTSFRYISFPSSRRALR